jgi:hypothetical protein
VKSVFFVGVEGFFCSPVRGGWKLVAGEEVTRPLPKRQLAWAHDYGIVGMVMPRLRDLQAALNELHAENSCPMKRQPTARLVSTKAGYVYRSHKNPVWQYVIERVHATHNVRAHWAFSMLFNGEEQLVIPLETLYVVREYIDALDPVVER